MGSAVPAMVMPINGNEHYMLRQMVSNVLGLDPLFALLFMALMGINCLGLDSLCQVHTCLYRSIAESSSRL